MKVVAFNSLRALILMVMFLEHHLTKFPNMGAWPWSKFFPFICFLSWLLGMKVVAFWSWKLSNIICVHPMALYESCSLSLIWNFYLLCLQRPPILCHFRVNWPNKQHNDLVCLYLQVWHTYIHWELWLWYFVSPLLTWEHFIECPCSWDH